MIGIINPGSGNITSICDALERLNRNYKVLSQSVDTEGLGQILLPGQGRFGAVMNYLSESGWDLALKAWVNSGKPLFGICVGMQVLFESSEEDPGVAGLGIFPGKVTKLNAPKQPMMGWATVHWKEGSSLPAGAAYFVNSFVVCQTDVSLATTNYGETFSSAVSKDQVCGFQFHPEKSGAWGKEVMNQCLIS